MVTLSLFCLILSSAAAQYVKPTSIDQIAYAAVWNNAQDISGLMPVTGYPANHPKVTEGVCNFDRTIEAGGRIMPNDAYSRMAKEDGSWDPEACFAPPSREDCEAGLFSEADCQKAGTGGAQAFYAYNYPDTTTGNTGYMIKNSAALFTLVDSDFQTFLVVTWSAPKNDGGGSVGVDIVSSGLIDDPYVRLVFMDDPQYDPITDKSGNDLIVQDWDSTTGTAILEFKWNKCCSDGFVMGPFPAYGWTLTLNVIDSFDGPVRGLDFFQVGDYRDGEIDWIKVPTELLTKELGGLQILAMLSPDYCALYDDNCHDCAAESLNVCAYCSMGGNVPGSCQPNALLQLNNQVCDQLTGPGLDWGHDSCPGCGLDEGALCEVGAGLFSDAGCCRDGLSCECKVPKRRTGHAEKKLLFGAYPVCTCTNTEVSAFASVV